MRNDIELTLNGQRYQTTVETGMTLLELLRGPLHATGTKEGCGVGECGACSVILDGRVVLACLVLAVEAHGSTVETIEGEAVGDELSILQRAFVEHHALQCGFCTPGMIVAARDLLRRRASPTDAEIVEAIGGNLCRCTGYETVIVAVRAAAEQAQMQRNS